MIGPDFEYRLYEDAPASIPLDYVLLTVASDRLEGLRLNSTDSLRSQLVDHFREEPIKFGDVEIPIESYLNSLDPNLRLPRIDRVYLGEVEWPPYLPSLYRVRLRFFLDGDWEILLPAGSLRTWPDQPSLLETKLNQIRFVLAVAEVNLLNFKIIVETQGELATLESEWKYLASIPVLEDGSGLRGVIVRMAYRFLIDQAARELVEGSGNTFRPVRFALAERESETEVGDIRFGTVTEYIINALRLLSPGGNLAYWLAEKILETLTENLIDDQLSAIEIPGFLDFPDRERYGPAFQRPGDEHANLLYRPGIDIVGDDENRRSIHFLHVQPEDRPGADPGDFIDPEIFDTPLDQIDDYVHVNDLVVDIFDTRIPIPDFNTAKITGATIESAVGQFADPRFRNRDRSILYLLAEGLSTRIVSSLRWDQIDLQNQTLNLRGSEGNTLRQITQESARALSAWNEERNRYVLFHAPGAPRDVVFPTRQGRSLGERGVTSIGLAYDRLVDLFDKWPPDWPTQYSERSPLPETLASLALGYSVNFVVPNLQYGFLHAAGGFEIQKTDFAAVDYESLYPFPPNGGTFEAATQTPERVPWVDFYSSSGRPELELRNLPVSLVMTGPGEEALRATVSASSSLAPVFLECPDCMRGEEEKFLGLLRNLGCLQEAGLIDITGNVSELLQCLLHLHAIALATEGQTTAAIQAVEVSEPGTFPSGTPDELKALLGAVLPLTLAELIPIPILFDLFHQIRLGDRDRENEKFSAQDGWFMLLQSISPFDLPDSR